MRKRNRKLTLTEIILGVNISYILFLGLITLYICLYPLKSLTRIDKTGNLIEIYFLAVFILLSIYASIYSHKTVIYDDSVLNSMGNSKLIFTSILGLSAIVPFLMYFKYKPAEEFFLYIFFSIMFVFSLLQTVFFYKDDKFSKIISMMIAVFVIISAAALLINKPFVSGIAATFALSFNTILDCRNI